MKFDEIELEIIKGLERLYDDEVSRQKIEEAKKVLHTVLEYVNYDNTAIVHIVLSTYFDSRIPDDEAKINYSIGMSFSLQEDIYVGFKEDNYNEEVERRIKKLENSKMLPKERINKFTYMGIYEATEMSKVIIDGEKRIKKYNSLFGYEN